MYIYHVKYVVRKAKTSRILSQYRQTTPFLFLYTGEKQVRPSLLHVSDLSKRKVCLVILFTQKSVKKDAEKKCLTKLTGKEKFCLLARFRRMQRLSRSKTNETLNTGKGYSLFYLSNAAPNRYCFALGERILV
jgi:hypothetical protein